MFVGVRCCWFGLLTFVFFMVGDYLIVLICLVLCCDGVCFFVGAG